MEYTIPEKHDNPICSTCYDNTPAIYNNCPNPCGRLLTWVVMSGGAKCQDSPGGRVVQEAKPLIGGQE